MIDAMVQGDYAHAGKDFDAEMAAGLDSERLRQLWAGLQARAGDFKKRGAPYQQAQAGYTLVIMPLHWAKRTQEAVVACDDNGKIAGFHMRPVLSATPPVAAGLGEQPLDVSSPLGPLPGILTLPTGPRPFPAVLLVAGSGPHDADETVGPNKTFRDLAQGLTQQGIASLRYAKRTRTYGDKMVGTDITIDDEVTNDAITAVRLLARQPHVDAHRVFVLGHSLGGMLAPRIGRRDPQLAGLIMLAAPARATLAVSAEQMRTLGPRMGRTPQQIESAEKANALERQWLATASSASIKGKSFAGVPQSYWLSLHNYNQVAVAQQLKMPLLILQGASDFQVSPTRDYEGWKKALVHDPRASFHIYPGLSHLFMPAGKTGTPADYKVQGHVDTHVIADIARWIKAQPAR